MSQESVKIVARVLEEFIVNRQASRELAPNFVWDMTTFRGWPDQPIFYGPEGFSEFLRAWIGPYDDWSMAVEEILSTPGGVLAILAQRGRLRGSQADVHLRYGQVYTVEDGRVRRVKVYRTAEEALEAVGLRE